MQGEPLAEQLKTLHAWGEWFNAQGFAVAGRMGMAPHEAVRYMKGSKAPVDSAMADVLSGKARRPVQWSLIRYVPNAITGEFVNVGVIAGRDDDWACRVAVDWTRAAALDLNGTKDHARTFIHDDIERTIATASDEWLSELPQEGGRSIVQVTAPMPVAADTAARAIELVYPHLVSERPGPPRSPETAPQPPQAEGAGVVTSLAEAQAEIERLTALEEATYQSREAWIKAAGDARAEVVRLKGALDSGVDTTPVCHGCGAAPGDGCKADQSSGSSCPRDTGNVIPRFAWSS